MQLFLFAQMSGGQFYTLRSEVDTDVRLLLYSHYLCLKLSDSLIIIHDVSSGVKQK